LFDDGFGGYESQAAFRDNSRYESPQDYASREKGQVSTQRRLKELAKDHAHRPDHNAHANCEPKGA